MRTRMFLLRSLIAAGFILSLLSLPALSAPAQERATTVTILHVNDSHSHLLPYGPKDRSGNWTWGGLARVATLVKNARTADPNALFLHGGDLFVGDFAFQEYLGVPELQILKSLGTDALVLGNHEFDLYPSTLKYVLATAGFPDQGFPVLCANLDASADPEIPHFVRPYTIKQIGNVRVGILGLTTDFANQGSNPSPLVVLPPLSVAQAWVDSLRNVRHCDLVLVLSHLGVDADQALASSVTGIDVIVGGHSHTLLSAPLTVGRTLIVQAGEFYGHMGRLQLRVAGGTVRSWNYKLVKVDAGIPADPQVQGMIDQLAAGVEADPRFGPVYSRVLGLASTNLNQALGTGLCTDNALGNLIADSYRALAGTDIAFQPQGFINQSIWAGPIKGCDIFQADPYGFDQDSGLGLKLATFRTDGASLIRGLEFALYNMPYVPDFFLHASGLSFVCNSSLSPGERIVASEVRVNGEPLDPSRSYTLAVPDGVIPFLGQIPGFLMDDLVVRDEFVYQVLRDYLVAHSPVAAYTEGRALDLARLSPPVQGIDALAEVVTLFRTNGSIRNPYTAYLLDTPLDLARFYLRHGDNAPARSALLRFERIAGEEGRAGRITMPAVDRLCYLAEALRSLINAGHHSRMDDSLQVGRQPAADLPALALNVPNPCGEQSRIGYRLINETDVRLTVIDALGRRVRTLIDGRQPAGERSILWDGRDDRGGPLPSGKYFLTLQAGGQRQVRNVLLIH
jgi:5'-nucleotidase/UDP-sugar diphosphatase